MPRQHTLRDTEKMTAERLKHLDVDLQAGHALLSIYRAANAARTYLSATVLRPNELTWSGFLVLWVLWIWGRMETRNVAGSVGVTKATLTGVTDTLVGKGLVVRVPSTSDRRLVELELTQEGISLMNRLYPEFNRGEARLLRDMESEDMIHLTELLRQVVTLTEAVENEDEASSM
ncbi:MAG: MarR family transcriptional regulator [Ornithinimicrobium sp.]